MKPMKPLLQEDADEFERMLLGSDDEEPAPGARDRAIAVLGLAGVPAAPEATPSSAGAGPSSGVVAMNAMKWLLPLTLVVASGTVMMMAWPDGTPSGASAGGLGSPAGEASALPSKSEARPAPVNDDIDEIAASPTITPNTLPDAPTKREAPAPGAARVTESARTTEVRGATPNDDALARETALVDEARSALGKGESAGALALLDRHDCEFPSGAFSLDARVLRIEALERAGRTAEADRLATEFLSRHPAGSYARRVRTVQDRIARLMGAPTTGAPMKEPVQ